MQHSGQLYWPNDDSLMTEQFQCQELMYDYNATRPHEQHRRGELLRQMFAEIGDNCYIEPPFYANWGGHYVHFGDGVYANFGLTCVDDTHIYVGSHTMFAPHVTLATAGHPIIPSLRLYGIQHNQPIHIGQNCWLGTGVIVMPGVTIGDNTVIGAGSVVTKDIPANVVAVGNPCQVLLLNGSPHAKGSTYTALHEMETVFHRQGIETELIQVGHLPVRGCIACGGCRKAGKCVFDDIVNTLAPKFQEADGLVVGSPVYYASANGTLVSVLQRLFYSTGFDKTMKVGAAVASARRGGLTATFDELNKFFTISGMPVASGQYWNGIHGNNAAEACQDAEGLQMMRTLAANMAFLMEAIARERTSAGLPEKEPKTLTNFIR